MSEKRRLILAHQEARKRAVQAVLEAPEGFLVTIEPPKRNLSQNAALHAKIGEIAATREWCGRKWDAETWKRLLTSAWCRATAQPLVMLPALDGAGVDIVFRKTSTLSKAECGELLTFIDAWDAGA